MSDFRDEISLLIPAYLRGDLDDAERTRVEAAAKTDPAIARDLEQQKRLRATLQGEEASAPAGGFDALMADIRRTGGVAPLAVAANDRAPRKAPAFWRVAALALGVAAVGQAGYIATTLDDAPAAVYAPVSEAPEDAVLRVGFADGTSEAALRSALIAVDARIVDGPSALGLYTLEFPDADAREAARAELQASALIDTVSEG